MLFFDKNEAGDATGKVNYSTDKTIKSRGNNLIVINDRTRIHKQTNTHIKHKRKSAKPIN